MSLPPYTPLKLPWYPTAVRINTIGDGSCFFHALALSYCKVYREGDNAFKRSFVTQLRQQLALALKDKYNTLSRGQLLSMSKDMDKYTLQNMENELKSSSAVDNLYLELCSEVMEKDIYILDAVTRDIYRLGKDNDLLVKNRDSIVIAYLPGHYELVGDEQNGFIRTLFPYTHPFIQAIKSR